MKKFLFLLLLLPLFSSAQIGHIFNAYFEVGEVVVLTNDTVQIEMLKWGGMQTPQGVSSYDQTDIQPGFIVWYFCDRYEVVGNDGIRLKMLPLNGPYDNPVYAKYRVWVVDEITNYEGTTAAAPEPPVFEPNAYGIYLQAANCISAYYASKNYFTAGRGLFFGEDNELRVGAAGGLVIANDSVQIEPRGIHGYMINQMGATSGQALAWNGSNWQPATISGGGSSQNLSLTGQSLGISGGTGVTLPVVGITAGTNVTTSTTAGTVTINATAPTYTVLDAGAVGDQNDWSPTSYTSLTRHIKLQPNSGVTTISGIVPLGAGNFQLVLENTGQYFAVLTHEDANSTAANRFTLDAPFVVLRPGGTVTLSYVTNRWEVIAASAPRKTRYTNELAAFQRISGSPATTDNFTAAGSGGGGTGTSANSTMQIGYGGVSTSSSATGRYALSATAIPYFSDKGEVSFFRATVQPNTAAPDGTESYIIAVGYIGSVDLSTNPKTAAFVAGVSGSTYCGVTLTNTNWWCITYDGAGTAESFDTGIAPAYSGTVNSTNLRELTVSLTDAGVRYWIDGVLQTTHSTETTFSSTLTAAVAIDKTLGTTARTCAVSTLEIYYNDNF